MAALDLRTDLEIVDLRTDLEIVDHPKLTLSSPRYWHRRSGSTVLNNTLSLTAFRPWRILLHCSIQARRIDVGVKRQKTKK